MDKVSDLGAAMCNGYQMNQSFAVWRILVGALVIIAFYALGLFGVGFVLNGWIGFDFAQSGLPLQLRFSEWHLYL